MRNICVLVCALLLAAGAAQAQKVWSFETAGNNEGWTQGSGITSFATSGGSLNVGHNTSDPNIYSPDMTASPVAGGSLPWIKIDLEATVTGDYQIFFIRTDRGIGEEDSFFFRVTAGRQLYQIHVPRRLNEQGKNGADLWSARSIKQFRFDFQDGIGTVKIHNFAVEALPHPFWDFNIPPGVAPGHASGWYVANQLSNFVVTAAGTLNMNITGTDPHMQVDPLTFDPNAFRYMYVRQNHTGFPSNNPATAQTFAFPGTGGTGFVNKDWRHYPNNGWSTVLLDMHTRTTNASWAGASGSISSLRVDPYQSTDTNGALYSYDIIGLRTAADLGSAAVQWTGMSGAGAWIAAKHSPYAGSAVGLAGGVATLTQGTGGQPMAMMNQDFVVNAANRYLYMDIEADTTAARNNLELRVMWAADGEDFATGNRQRQYTSIRTKQGVNRYVFDLGTAQASPFNGAWGGYPHGLLFQFGTGDADLSWVKVSNAGLLPAAPPQINFVDTEAGSTASAYGRTMTLAAGTGVTWSLVGTPPAGMTINSGSGLISWPSPVYSASAYTVTVRATNAQGSDDESFTLTIADGTAPSSPSVSSTSHFLGELSNDMTIDMRVNNATDSGSGVSGYSWVFSTSASAAVDDTVDTPHTADPHTITSAALADGNWYFRVKARDVAGNWSGISTWGPTQLDGTPPVISLQGAPSVVVSCGGSYSDAGATALDNVNGNMTGAIVRVNPVNPLVPATYTVTYNVTDAAGNAAVQVTREVVVSDTAKPVITVCAADQTVAADGACQALVPDFTAGVTASDACDSSLAVTQSPPAGASAGPGPNTVTISVADDAGNIETCTAVLTVEDAAAPEITVCAADQTVAADGACQALVPDFTAGVTASDACDSSLTVTQSPSAGATVGLGPNTITVTVTDDAGLSDTCTAVLTVADQSDPVITGHNSLKTASADENCQAAVPDFTAEVTASDNCDGSLTVTQLPAAGTPAAPGVTVVTLTVADDAGNTASVAADFQVDDTTGPVITIAGANPLNVEVGSVFSAPEATVLDACEGDLGVAPVTGNTVNTASAGAYQVTYAAQDGAGNPSTAVLDVNVVNEVVPPEITLLGDAVVTLDCGAVYADAGATALDNVDGDLSAAVVVTGLPPAATPLAPGAYTVAYNVSDAAGNQAVEVTRTVTVRDNCTLDVAAAGVTDISLEPGGRLELAVLVSGAVGAPGYQWKFEASGKAFTPLSGATDAAFVVDPASETDSGVYVCEVNDAVTVVESPEFSVTVGSGVPLAGFAGLGLLAAVLGLGGAATLRRRK